VLIDTDGSNLVGFAAFGRSRDTDAEATWGELGALYYLKAYWGKGRAQPLYETVKTSLQKLGFSTTMLWVLEGNDRAIQFYRNNGFAFDGVTKSDEIGDFQMTEHRMISSKHEVGGTK